jgi:hypothetical protein
MPPYSALFPKGSTARTVAAERLREFKATWKYHHPLSDDQIAYGGWTAVVTSIGYYHGGDVIYELDGLPGIWHECCLEQP